MQLEDKQSALSVRSAAVVHIGPVYSGATISLAFLLPAGVQSVTVIVERDVHVIFTDSFIPSVHIKFECQPYSKVVYLLDSYVQLSNVQAHFEWHMQEMSSVECVLMSTIVAIALIMHVDIYLVGKDARASCHVLITIEQGAQSVIKTRQIHTGLHTTSLVRVHGLVGAAHLDYGGIIDVDRTSVGAKAIQASKNILLSKAGTVVAIPTLQVRTNQVHCTHGAAVGNLEAEHITYLQARGIDAGRARALLLNGFLMQAMEGASDVSVGFADRNSKRLIPKAFV